MNAQIPPSTPPKPDASALLASILGEFGTKPLKERRKERRAEPTVKPVQSPKSIAKQIALMRTGYAVWEPVGRAVFIRSQLCQCCGTQSDHIENELYILKHGKSQSRWYRPEGYLPGLECTDLPIEVHRIPDIQPVSVCPQCINTPKLDHLITVLTSPQLCLEFPDE